MKGAIMTSGGGGTKLFAAIGVTYPAGSTLTCTNGTKTLTAKPKSEDNTEWVFAIPEEGTWTVTSTDKTDSTKTKSQSVSITKEGQFESVAIVYWDGTIYDSGNEYTAQTGGWTISSYGASKDNNVLKVSVANTETKSWVRTTNKISLSGVSKIEAVITAQTHSSSWSGNERCRLVVSEKEDLSNQIATVQPSNSNAQTLTLSLEGQALTATYYVGLRASAGTASNASMTCSKIQLK